MNTLTKSLTQIYKPALAIIVHRTEEQERIQDNKYYLESHSINAAGQILEGKPLKQETIEEMVGVFFDDKKDRSLLCGNVPENLLSYDPVTGGKYRLVWYRPAEIRTIHFSPGLRIKSGSAWVPAMIYSVYGTKLFVYALKKNTRPTGESTSYRAPFHNVGDNGEVCLGSARIKKPASNSFLSAMTYWENLFWLSEFSHLNGASNPTKTNLDKVWKRIIAKKPTIKWSDIDELKSMKKNLENIFK